MPRMTKGKELYAVTQVNSIQCGEVLGENDYDPIHKDYKYRLRTGFNSHCICLNCLNQFDLDLKKDERQCPKCNPNEVYSELEMVGRECPKCHNGLSKRIGLWPYHEMWEGGVWEEGHRWKLWGQGCDPII